MKNQYVGDIGDFGKYSMLRFFAEAGIKVGVNWYLTENDGSSDGKFTSYLEKGKLRDKCPEVFDVLEGIAFNKNKSINDIQNSEIIKNAIYYDNLMKFEGKPAEREYERSIWFSNSKDVLSDAELIFMDPDNGLLESSDAKKKGAEKYVLPNEVELYYNAGHNVVYYCHRGRRDYNKWLNYKSLMFQQIPSAKPVILTYHKGSQRSYVFVIHEEYFQSYRTIIDSFLCGWEKVFSEEYTNKSNAVDKT